MIILVQLDLAVRIANWTRSPPSKIDETLKIYRDGFDPRYDHNPTVLITQGLLWNKTGKLKSGGDRPRSAVMRTQLLPKKHFWIALAKGALGECLTTQGRFDEAEALLRESRTSLQVRLGANDPRTKEASRRLPQLHDLSPQPVIAAQDPVP
ncbi:MAG: tetratricopeptide repeat protein [Chthoniobacterales bacterium]